MARTFALSGTRAVINQRLDFTPHPIVIMVSLTHISLSCSPLIILAGIRGGYELWEIALGHCIDKMMSDYPQTYPKEPNRRATVRRAFLEEFYRAKATVGLGNPQHLHANLRNAWGNSRKNEWNVTISPQALIRAWESAFRDVLNLAKHNINRVSKREGHRIMVLLSGGSMANDHARQEIESYCEDLKSAGINLTCKSVERDFEVLTRFVDINFQSYARIVSSLFSNRCYFG